MLKALNGMLRMSLFDLSNALSKCIEHASCTLLFHIQAFDLANIKSKFKQGVPTEAETGR